jgi:hypothetical protein
MMNNYKVPGRYGAVLVLIGRHVATRFDGRDGG